MAGFSLTPKLKNGLPQPPTTPGPMVSTMRGAGAQLGQHLNPATASVPRFGRGGLGYTPTPTVTPPRPVGDPSTVRPPVYGRGALTAQQIQAQHAARLAAHTPQPPAGAPYVPGGNVVGGPPPIGQGSVSTPTDNGANTPDYRGLWMSSPEYLATHPGLIAQGNTAAAHAGYAVHVDPLSGMLTTGDVPTVLSRESDPSSAYWANVDNLAKGIGNIQRSANSRGLLFSGSNAGSVGMANTAYQGQQAANFGGLRDALATLLGQDNSAFQLAKPGLVANAPVQGKV